MESTEYQSTGQTETEPGKIHDIDSVGNGVQSISQQDKLKLNLGKYTTQTQSAMESTEYQSTGQTETEPGKIHDIDSVGNGEYRVSVNRTN